MCFDQTTVETSRLRPAAALKASDILASMGLDAYGAPVEAKPQIPELLNDLQRPTASIVPHQEMLFQDVRSAKPDQAVCNSEDSKSESDTCTPDGWESWQGPDAGDGHMYNENIGMYQNANRANMVSWESQASENDEESESDDWDESIASSDRPEHETMKDTDGDSPSGTTSDTSQEVDDNVSAGETGDQHPENVEWIPDEEWRNRRIQVR